MTNNVFRKTLVIGIIILFVGVGIYPSSAIDTIKESIITLNHGNILYVGGSGEGNYTSIQDAIDDANSGDTVFVYDDSSPYYENVVIDKTINLIGENKETTIIDGNFVDNTIWVKAPSVNIIGFTVMDSINDGFSAGICVIEKHWWYPDDPPAYLTDISISFCILKNNDCGIRLSYAETVDISKCIISDNIGHSIYIISSSQVNIHQCEVYNNGEQGPNGVCQGGIIIWSDPFCNNGSNSIDISDCEIKNNFVYGVDIGGSCSDIRVHHNVISGNTWIGIFVHSGTWAPLSNISIYNNEIKNNGNGEEFEGGIFLQDCMNCVAIRYNTISSNNIYGVYLLRSYSNKIIKNNFVNNIKSAFFKYEPIGFRNTWDRNYWDRPRILPKPIFGNILIRDWFSIPWVNFDWNPAREPYEIEV